MFATPHIEKNFTATETVRNIVIGMSDDFVAAIPAPRLFRYCWARCSPSLQGGSVVPFKLHSKGRHHIPRQKHRVTNWREYDAALRNRGSLTIWFTEEALADWKAQPRTTPGGQRHYSDLAIETALDSPSGVSVGFAPNRRIDAQAAEKIHRT